MASEYLQEFERLNTTTESIHDLEGHEALIILENGENLTRWVDVGDRKEIIYVSEDLSDYADLSQRYLGLESLRAIVAWGISDEVKSMREMFGRCKSLKDISCLKGWDVSNVSDMGFMFWDCYGLGDLSALKGWDVSNVSDMKGMFKCCYYLACLDGLESWDVSSVTDMGGMFSDCILKDISALKGWDVSNVVNMNGLFGIGVLSLAFGGAGNSLTDLSAVKDWDVSAVKDMSFIFSGSKELTDLTPLESWDTSNVEDMSFMFSDCSDLKSLGGLEGWDVSNVSDINLMFANCHSLEDISALSNWKLPGDAFIRDMFKDCYSLEDASCLNAWESHSATDKYMFSGCSSMRKYPSWVRTEEERKREFHPLFGEHSVLKYFRDNEKRANGFAKLDRLIHSGQRLIVLDHDIELGSRERSQYKNGITVDVDDVIIDGRGHVINADEKGRIFDVSARNVTIKNVILGGGLADKGGAIFNRGELVLDRVCFIRNDADEGGAVYNCGMLKINEATFKKNAAKGNGGAMANVKGRAKIFETLIIKNSAKGSAIYNDDGTLEVSRCDITENEAQNGPVVMNRAGNLLFSDCKVNLNSSSADIFRNAGTLQIRNAILRDSRSDRIIFNDENGNLEIIQSELVENDVKQAVVFNGAKCGIDKAIFSNNLSNEEAMNIINDSKMRLYDSKITDSGKTILNRGCILVRMRQEDVSQKILNEGRCEMQ